MGGGCGGMWGLIYDAQRVGNYLNKKKINKGAKVLTLIGMLWEYVGFVKDKY